MVHHDQILYEKKLYQFFKLFIKIWNEISENKRTCMLKPMSLHGMKMPACRTSRESMGVQNSPNNFDLNPVTLTYDL